MTREDERDMACTNWICSQENGTVIMARNVWRAAVEWADQHPQWIPVEERLPRINDVASTWDCSDDVYVYLATRSCCVGRYENDKLTNEFYWVLYGVDKDIPVTHWMEIVPPRKQQD